MNEPGITQLLNAWRAGDRAALDRLMPLVYEELKRLAGHQLRHEHPGHTLQSTALVNEAYLRMVRGPAVNWENRAHFYGIAARLIRQILVDHARRSGRAKRGGGGLAGLTLSLDEAMAAPGGARQVDLVRLEDALEALTRVDEQQSRIVEL
jgi:RNA polymerase sigma factor (TIGR02999 family)